MFVSSSPTFSDCVWATSYSTFSEKLKENMSMQIRFHSAVFLLIWWFGKRPGAVFGYTTLAHKEEAQETDKKVREAVGQLPACLGNSPARPPERSPALGNVFAPVGKDGLQTQDLYTPPAPLSARSSVVVLSSTGDHWTPFPAVVTSWIPASLFCSLILNLPLARKRNERGLNVKYAGLC